MTANAVKMCGSQVTKGRLKLFLSRLGCLEPLPHVDLCSRAMCLLMCHMFGNRNEIVAKRLEYQF